MTEAIQYVEPREVANASDCNFYHTMELPGAGLVQGAWDLRDTIDAYLGNLDYKGKTVLDVGTASGYLTFEMEKRGGIVTSFEMVDSKSWNLVPYVHPGIDLKKIKDIWRANVVKLQNSYWYAHKALQSKARVYYGDVYNIPKALGQYDIVMLGMILPHLRDPFQGLFSAALRSRDTLVITQQAPQNRESMAYFMPNAKLRQPLAAWWSMSEECVKNCIEIVGFEIVSMKRCEHLCSPHSSRKEKAGPEFCTTFVAKRKYSAAQYEE